MRSSLFAVLGAAVVLIIPRQQDPAPTLEFSGPPKSAEPFLTSTARGGLLLTWLEPTADKRWALRIAAREGDRWTTPATVAEHDRFFVNWADFPSVIEGTDGKWIVHWLEKTAAKSYAYHIRTSVSADRGKSWSTPVTPHSDTSATEHGFVAMAPRAGGGADLVWLDGRQTADPAARGAMALVTGSIDRTGRSIGETILDARVCDCCQTALARTSEGLIAVYRDRTESEIRDISIVRRINGKWTAPVRIAEDGWHYRACPVNGPSIAATGKRVAVAWFTAADSTPRVKLVVSLDAGATFTKPLQVDDGSPLGRADVELLADGSALVTWLELVGDRAEWRVKRVGTDRAVMARWTIGSAPRTREAGFARAALVGGELFVAWTESGEGGGVRVHRVGPGTSPPAPKDAL